MDGPKENTMYPLFDTEKSLVSRHAFWDPAIHREELERIFRRCWLFVAHESEIVEPGDYVTRRMGVDPVIVIRDEEGRPRVFMNTCPHRGTQLCRADLGNTSLFRCSYHGWTFDSTGACRGIPEMNEVYSRQFDKSKIRLFEAPHVDTFAGLVFATWDADAPGLADYLGDVGWYLQASIGKPGGVEVVGPPARGIVATNWKVGAENYGGDGYHLTTAHKVVVDLGVFDTGRDSAPLEPTLNRALAHCIDAGNGHGVRVQQLPIAFEKPTFLGYPEELWGEFASGLDAGQIELEKGLAVTHGNVFPNLSFLEGLLPRAGSDMPPVSVLHIRQWQPLAVDSTELLMWALVPKKASSEWKLTSQRAVVRTLGFGGIVETDDFQNWTSMSGTNRSPVAWDRTYNYQGREHERATDVGWPGKVYAVDHAEVNQRAMYRRWCELMGGSHAKGGPR